MTAADEDLSPDPTFPPPPQAVAKAVARAKIPRPPTGLGASGRRFWRETCTEYVLSGPERALLEQACRTMDRLAALDAAVVRDGVTVEGSAGQPRAHPALVELRAQQLVLGKVLAQLELPDEEGDSLPSLTEARARRAAQARWRPHNAKGGRRG